MLQKNFLILVSGILRNEREEVLLLLRSNQNSSYQGCWQLPEGKIEFGEKPEEALGREIKEEIGLFVTSSALCFVTTTKMFAKGEDYHVVRIVYEVKCDGSVKLDSDHDDFCWLNPLQINQLQKKIDGLDEIIEHLKK